MDDDTFVQPYELLKSIERVPAGLMYLGHMQCSQQPNREEDSRYFMPHKEYSKTDYPPFANGQPLRHLQVSLIPLYEFRSWICSVY